MEYRLEYMMSDSPLLNYGKRGKFRSRKEQLEIQAKLPEDFPPFWRPGPEHEKYLEEMITSAIIR